MDSYREDATIEEAISDIGTLVQKQIDGHKESYIKYAELVEQARLGKYSLNGEFRHMCPILDVPYYANLGEKAQALLQDYGENLQCSKERSLVDKKFNKWKLEEKYKRAQERPYKLAKGLVFGVSTVASTIILGYYILPDSNDVNVTAMAEIMGVIIGGACWVVESCFQPLGKVLKPLEKVIMLDYEFKDMRGTSVYDEILEKQYVKKLYQNNKKSYIDIPMRA